MNPEFTPSLFLQALDDWGRYEQDFKRLPPEEGAAFLKGQGYASARELLVHASVWWEEAEGIIRDALAGREHPSRKYDFDSFNAASLARFKDTPDAEFFAWYESGRRRMIDLVTALTPEQLKKRRVYGWLNAVVLMHLKEHAVAASRFLVLDTLEREWGSYLEDFRNKPEDKQKAWLQKQGYPRFRDVTAHIVAWWEDGEQAMVALSKDPAYRHPEKDTDAYNAEAVKSFGELDELEVWKRYETARQSLIELAINLPDEVFNHHDVQTWLRADVIEHYFEHTP